jgi:hypothetical protein
MTIEVGQKYTFSSISSEGSLLNLSCIAGNSAPGWVLLAFSTVDGLLMKMRLL